MPTPEQARAELARRELARRGQSQPVLSPLQKAEAKYITWMGPEGSFGANPAGKAMSLVQKPFTKAGEFITEQMGKKQMNPYLSAGIGTAVQMAPIIALNSIPATETEELPNAAIGAQRRAYGFQKSLLKTPFARGKAAQAAKTGLEQGITSATGNPEVMMSKATALAGKAGQQIGDIRESVGPQPVNKIIDALDEYKASRLKGASGGIWDTVASKIEEAKNTIKGLVKEGTIEAQPEKTVSTGLVGPQGQEITKTIQAVKGYIPPVSLKRVADAKTELGKTINWFTDNLGQMEGKKIAGIIEKAIEETISDAGGAIEKYKSLKPIYGAMKTIQKGLSNEIAAQQGNMAISLPSQVMAGAGAAATGNPLKALGAMGGTELLKRRGAGATASLLKDLYQSKPQLIPALLALMRSKKINEQQTGQ